MSKLITLSKGYKTIVDDEDYPTLSQMKWHIHKSRTKMYVRSAKGVRMHRLLLNPPYNMVVDHINGDTLDNRKENLRICTISQNTIYGLKRLGKLTRRNIFQADKNSWQVSISLGTHRTKDRAEQIYQQAMILLRPLLDELDR